MSSETNPEAPKVSRNPLVFHTKPYRGQKQKLKDDYMRRLENTRRVEDYLNSIKTESLQVKTVFEIARAIGMDENVVRDVLTENGHGWNGITF